VTIGFYLLDTGTLDSLCGYACAKALVRSARYAMPGVDVVQFTDEESPAACGVDEVHRMPREKMARLRMRHHANVTGDWLFVDTDVIFQRDVRRVFDKPFDLAVSDREWDHVKPAAGFTKRMPINMGVVFSRNPSFWAECHARLKELPKDKQHWMGDQEVFCDLIDEGRYQVRHLPGAVYNFPPALDETEDTAGLEAAAAIVHFKGPHRKPLMLRRIGERIP
jgi:hypothetical protein